MSRAVAVSISKGLRPTPPPRVVFCYAYSECLHIRCSCSLFLGHSPCCCFFLFLFLFLFSEETAKNVSEPGENRLKMLLEVTSELHGKPLAPKMHPGQKNDIKLDFLPPRLGTILGTFSKNIWKRTIRFFLVV